MRALVTGASGFVGRHLVAHLRDAGDEVLPLSHEVDVADGEAVQEAVAVAAPGAVYHLAAVSHVGESWDAPARTFRVNAEGTLHVLRAAVAAGAQRVLVVGSAEEYGVVDADDLPLDEDAPLRPVTPYAASKVAAEFLALQAHLGDGLHTVRARAFNHTGPGQSERFFVPALARRIAEAERTGASQVRMGSPEPLRDFTDVRDVVRAYRLLVERGEAGAVYNVCSGTGVSVGEIARRMVAAAGTGLEVVVDDDLVRPVDIPRIVGDPTRLTRATGWAPEIPLDVTLTDVLSDARAGVHPRS